MWQYNYNSIYLCHWGIKGQKWGVRRYQNRDGTLTPAGKKRYADDPEYQDQLINAKQNYKRAFAVYAKNPYSLSNKKRYKNAKKDYEDAKAKVNIPIKKTEHVLQLEEEYRKKGYTSEEAELAAYKRNTTEKVLIAIGVGAITAGAIYAGYKFYDRNIDKTLKVGTVLQNISTNGNKGIEDAFYAAYNPLDKMKYKGIYGKQLRSSSLKKVYSTESKVKETGLKIASVNNAKKTFVDLMNSDSEFNKMVTDEISSQHNSRFFVGTPKQKDMFKKAVDAINSGRINDNSVYNAMNYMRVSHDERGQNISKKFYSALKSKGYSAIQDINDKYDSGYNAIQPLIVFGGKDTLSISNRKVLEAREITKNNKAAMNMLAADVIKSKVVVPYGAGIVAMYSGTKIGDLYGFKKDSEIVSEYKKKHPNSNLSAKEIISNYKSK